MVTVIGGLAGAVVVALITAFAARRTTQGTVTSSTATDLWAQLQAEVERKGAEITELRTIATAATAAASACQAGMAVATTELAALRVEASDLRNRVVALERQLRAAKRRKVQS